jgi:hypothetical protein
LINSTTTNVIFVSGNSAMEFGGNSITKMGICYSTPIRITNAANSLIVQLKNDVSSTTLIQVTAGFSGLLRIA